MTLLAAAVEALTSIKFSDRSYGDYAAAAAAIKPLVGQTDDESQLKVAILRNFTVEMLLPVMQAEIALCGKMPSLYVGDFDAIATDVFDKSSPLYQSQPNIICLMQWLDQLQPQLARSFYQLDHVTDAVQNLLNEIRECLSALRQNTNAAILINNFPVNPSVAFGILDSQSSALQRSTLEQVNRQLISVVNEFPDIFVVDIQRIFNDLGYRNAFDRRYWLQAYSPFTAAALVAVGQEYGKFFRALQGLSKKCLVLDCDNTLWGGIIGEDGLDGIKLGPEYPGTCYVAFQQEVLNLYNRGILIALCSKNNENDVIDVLNKHAHMSVKETHLATWQINWDDKATNLKRIAADLNIGLDTLVFVDDNPFEINLINDQLPEVATILFPKTPSQASVDLLSQGYFDSLIFSQEDRARSQSFVAKRSMLKEQDRTSSPAQYLAKLQIEVAIEPPEKEDLVRIGQLILKTNQFNLTTRRHSQSLINTFAEGQQGSIFQAKVKDRLVNLGLVGVGILRWQDNIGEIDSFLLSCRSLGRGVETALLHKMLDYAFNTKGCSSVLARYIKSAKNEQVRDFFKSHGFTLITTEGDDTTWQLTVADIQKSPIQVPSWLTLT